MYGYLCNTLDEKSCQFGMTFKPGFWLAGSTATSHLKRFRDIFVNAQVCSQEMSLGIVEYHSHHYNPEEYISFQNNK